MNKSVKALIKQDFDKFDKHVSATIDEKVKALVDNEDKENG